MQAMLTSALSLAMLATQSLGAQQTPDPATPLSPTTFAAWRDHIAPTEAEQRWQQIAWHDSLSSGVAAAAEQQRPMLLWLMNGHPLGCT